MTGQPVKIEDVIVDIQKPIKASFPVPDPFLMTNRRD
jgi:hypothetical protein